mmetsp:Transcript_18260/g.55061  ORF Transcript_18260/g.55061 Transcript_18260/m.55061 type:complete len:390 (+) Transcript_18260:256-1425(+)|eukprot:scaffold34630_cov31-Tisochrysis_lutea.AAC.4
MAGEEESGFPLALALGVVLTSFVAEFVYGLVSFGPAITFHVGFHMLHLLGLTAGTVADAVGALVFPEFAMGFTQTLLLYRGASLQLYLAGASCLLCGLLAGLALLSRIGESIWLKRSIGLGLLLLAFERIWAMSPRREKSAMPREEIPVGATPNLCDPSVLASVVVCFVASGFVGGLTAVMGPPLMVFVALNEKNLSMQTWRSTGACIRLTLASVRLVYWLGTGAVDMTDSSSAWVVAYSVVSALCGLCIGNKMNSYISSRQWRRGVVCILLAAAILLATSDVTKPFPLEDVTVILIVAAPASFLLVRAVRWLSQCYARCTGIVRVGSRSMLREDSFAEARDIDSLTDVNRSSTPTIPGRASGRESQTELCASSSFTQGHPGIDARGKG